MATQTSELITDGDAARFPLHALSGPDDAGDRGNWIPTTNLTKFPSQNVGFV